LAGFVGSFRVNPSIKIKQMYLFDLYLHFLAGYCADFGANTVI